MVPSISMNARITQNHEISSRFTFSPAVAFCSRSSRSSAATAALESAFTMGLHLELNQLRRIDARITGGAEFIFVVADGVPQIFQRNVTQRIRFQVGTNLFHGMIRCDQFLARWSVHAVVT